ncbi:protein of unknown function [Desulfomicrobium apsheronum]|uniref:DUF4123 domain-containing protein n=1 Tax=Desulfomicrobium apsheronum TaxID=52560 RepID=A0A1I3ZDL7_9BACT|nr:DUF4123 domain-containing protein [Desulfomicrobium apsheronum]SFK42278.1 protein of unknown function [Desulfomicrobium apsheronum]
MDIQNMDAAFDLLGTLAGNPNNIYLLMDGARFKNIHAFIYEHEDNPDYIPLYRGTYYESLVEVSPCLVRIKDMHRGLMPWFVRQGADELKALALVSTLPLKDLAEHFRTCLEANLPNQGLALFRFYDPSVMVMLASPALQQQAAFVFKHVSEMYWKIDGAYKSALF